MTINRFLYNNKNLLKGKPVVATDVRETGNAVKSTGIVRQGTGDVRLITPYTGDEDATFDVKIVSDTSGTKTISEVEFQGVGNGEMTGVSSTGLDAQDIIVELIDLGTVTTFAATDLFGGLLKAKASGPNGNQIRIIVDLSNIVRTAIAFSVFSTMSKGAENFEGDEWFFGDDYNKPLDAFGNVIADTKRLSFGTDPQVYKMYRIWELFRYIHYITPVVIREIPAGTVVKEVTGYYAITVTDGTTTETYTSVISRYDFLDLILSNSNLLTFEGAVNQDFTPSGMATLDFDLITEPFDLPITTDGSSFVNELQNTDLDIVLSENHPHETVELKCINNDSVGAEKWSLTGALSGLRGLNATTNIRYLDLVLNLIRFKIPEKTAPAQDALMRWIKTTYATRGGGEFNPPICPDLLTLGTGAVAKTITLTYTERPVLKEDCECEGTGYQGAIRPFCLGFSTNFSEGGEVLSQPIKQRLTTLYEWAKGFIDDNTSIVQDVQGFKDEAILVHKYTAAFQFDRVDIEVCEQILSYFHSTLASIEEHEANDLDEWTLNTVYAEDALIKATAINRYFRCKVAGTSNPVEPVWAADWIDHREAPGTLTWQDLGPIPLDTWDALFTIMEADMAVIDDQDGGEFWKMHSDHITTSTEIDSPVWQAANTYKVGDVVIPTGAFTSFYRFTLVCSVIVDGVSAGAEPTWADFYFGDTIEDNVTGGPPPTTGLYWVKTKYLPPNELFKQGSDETITFFMKKYKSMMNTVLVAADLQPIYPLDIASAGSIAGGSPCWQDQPDETHYWSINDDEYLPAFNNRVYHAVKSYFDSDSGETVIYPTFEFALLLKIECVDDLKTGDKVYFEITGDLKTYAIDDIIEIPIIRAEPRYLTGGQTGNNLLTWRVTGTVDAFIDYILDTTAPAPYSDIGLAFLITPGGIAFNFSSGGTKFLFSIEAGQFQWQKNGAGYSGNLSIQSIPTPISDGLSVQFFPGPAPSFEINDIFSFQAIQQNAPSHTEYPNFDFWMYDDVIITLTYTLGASYDVDTFGLFHDLPEGATVQIYGSIDGFMASSFLITSLTWSENLIVKFMGAASTVTHLRLYITGAADGKVYWFHAEENWNISVQAQICELNDEFSMIAGAGPGKNAFFQGRGHGGRIEWNRWLTETDIDNIREMVRYLKESNEEFCIFVPNNNYPERSRLIKIKADAVTIVDRYNNAPRDDTKEPENRFSVKLPLQGLML